MSQEVARALLLVLPNDELKSLFRLSHYGDRFRDRQGAKCLMSNCQNCVLSVECPRLCRIVGVVSISLVLTGTVEGTYTHNRLYVVTKLQCQQVVSILIIAMKKISGINLLLEVVSTI